MSDVVDHFFDLADDGLELAERISKELRVCTQSMHKWEPGKIGAPDPPKE